MKSQAMTLLVGIANLADERQALVLFNNFLERVGSFPLSLILSPNKVQFTLLHVAVNKQWPALVERILEVNAKQNPVDQLKKDSLDQEGDTPLHIAAFKGDWDLVKTLMSCYFPVMLLNKNRQSAFSLALESGADVSLLKMLYDVAMLQRCTDDVDWHLVTCLIQAHQRHPDIVWALPDLESPDKQLLHFAAQYRNYRDSEPHKAHQYYENLLQVLIKVLNTQIDAKISLSEGVLKAMGVALRLCVDFAFVESAASIMNRLDKLPSLDIRPFMVGLGTPQVSTIQPVLEYLNEKIRSVLRLDDAVIGASLNTLGGTITDLYSLLGFLTDTPDFTVTTDRLLSLLDSQKQSSEFFDFICTMVKPFFERTPQQLKSICEKLIPMYVNWSHFIDAHKKNKKNKKICRDRQKSQAALYELLTAVITANKDHFTDALRDELAQLLCKNQTLLALWKTYGYTPRESVAHSEKKVSDTRSIQTVAAVAIASPVTAEPLQPVVISGEFDLVPRLISRPPSPNPTAEPWSSEDEAPTQWQKKKHRKRNKQGRKKPEQPAVSLGVPSNTSALAVATADSIAHDSDAKSTGAPASPVPVTPAAAVGAVISQNEPATSEPIQFVFGLPLEVCYQPPDSVNTTEQAAATTASLPQAEPPRLLAASAGQEPSQTLNAAAAPFQPRSIKIPGYPTNPEPFYIDPADLQSGLPYYNFEQANHYRQQAGLEGRFASGMKRAVILSEGELGYIELVINQQTERLMMELKNDQGQTLSLESIQHAPKHDRRVVAIVCIAGKYFKLSANPLEQDWLQSNAVVQQHRAPTPLQMPAMLWHVPVPVHPAVIFSGAQAPRPPFG